MGLWHDYQQSVSKPFSEDRTPSHTMQRGRYTGRVGAIHSRTNDSSVARLSTVSVEATGYAAEPCSMSPHALRRSHSLPKDMGSVRKEWDAFCDSHGCLLPPVDESSMSTATG